MPAAFVSITLSRLEIWYSHIKREMHVIVFSLGRFHHYIQSHKVTIQTDHKPLELIALKNLAQAPLRLAKMVLKFQNYDSTVKFSPGTAIPITDCFPIVSPKPGWQIEGFDINIHIINTHFSNMYTRHQSEDYEGYYSVSANRHSDDWVAIWLLQLSASYWNFRDEIRIQDSILLKGSKSYPHYVNPTFCYNFMFYTRSRENPSMSYNCWDSEDMMTNKYNTRSIALACDFFLTMAVCQHRPLQNER